MTPIDLDELEQAAKDATPFEDGEPEGEAYGVPGAYFAKWKATSGGVFFSKYDAIYSSKITPATVIALIAAARENAALRERVKEECAKVVESSLIDRGNFIGGYSTHDIKKPAIEHAAAAIRAMK